MFLAGEIARREAVSRPLLENAYASFVDQGYLARASGGKIALTESYATPERRRHHRGEHRRHGRQTDTADAARTV